MNIEAFREEIIETQKARSDLLKWKLVITAALAAVGLGVTTSSSNKPSVDIDLALCLIPFVCAYVDLLCYHLNLRMFVINKFFKRIKTTNKSQIQTNKSQVHDDLLRSIRLIHDYEETCEKVRFAFELESSTLKWSSIVLSLLVIAYSYYANTRINAIWFLLAGILGVIMAYLSERVYEYKCKELERKDLPEIDLTEPPESPKSISNNKKTQSFLSFLRYVLNYLLNKERLPYIICVIYSMFLFVVGIWLIVIYLTINLESKSCGGLRYPEVAFLLILSGILCIFSSTLIENFFRKNIWSLFSLYSLIIPIIGIFLSNKGFFLSSIHVCIDNNSKNMIYYAIQHIGLTLMKVGFVAPLLLLLLVSHEDITAWITKKT